MSVNRIKEVDINTTPNEGHGLINIIIMDRYSPILIDTYWCDEVIILWDCNPPDFEASVYVYSVKYLQEDEIDYQIVEEYQEPNIMEAVEYALKKLT